MVHGILAAISVVNAVTATSFLAVGVHLARRDVPARDRLALGAMATWWLCMGALVGLQAIEALAAVAGATDIGVSRLIRYANAGLLAAGGWGLCFHVLFLRTGRRAWAWRIVPYYGVVFALYAASVALHPIVDLEVTGFELTSTNDPPLEGSTLWTIVVAAVGLPLIAACILYLVLSRHLQRRDQKRRALLASSGILSWVGAGLVVQLVAGAMADFLTITVLGLVAAVLVALAYFPPASLRKHDAPGEFIEVAQAPGAGLYEPAGKKT